jgi:hypothetical protein
MAKRVFVTGAQTTAAKTILKRNAAKGKPTRTAVKKLASASALSQTRSKSGATTHTTKRAAVEAARRNAKG